MGASEPKVDLIAEGLQEIEERVEDDFYRQNQYKV